MIEVLDGTMVYATVDEKDLVDRLFGLKPPAAFYYDKGSKVGYHWNLNPVTITKLKITPK